MTYKTLSVSKNLIERFSYYFMVGIFLSSTFCTHAQVKIGGDSGIIDDNSILELESSDKVFVPTRMSTAQRNAISTPLEGAIIYNTDTNCLDLNKGTDTQPLWECIQGTSSNSIGGIYQGHGVVPSNTVAILSDKLTFSGDIVITGEMTAASDLRLKENVNEIKKPLDLITLLKPQSYNFKKDLSLNLPLGKQYGLIAQQVEENFPEMVSHFTTNGINNYKSVNYQSFISILIAGMQDQQQELDLLKKELNTLRDIIKEKD